MLKLYGRRYGKLYGMLYGMLYGIRYGMRYGTRYDNLNRLLALRIIFGKSPAGGEKSRK